ncbi:MAG: PhzF family phenazine biosynthesis protein [Clostridiales bacterium]|nr:PhzF family phenazine biosynthesis protein [Clostridiales bacterium]
MNIDVLIYDAFSYKPGKGNPAGVVIDASKLSDLQMQEVAKELGFNETAFVCRNSESEITIRYFTPRHEVPLCGHATIASMVALVEYGLVKEGQTKIHTAAGILDIEIKTQQQIMIGMKQTTYKEMKFEGSIDSLAKVLGLKSNMIDEQYPIRYVNTGLWTLLVPIKELAYFKDMKPNTKEFPAVLKELNKASIHPFCLETYRSDCQMHARHFSSPYSGTIEDAVTGTASGAMGAYYQKYIKPCNSKQRIRIEQGNEIGREGFVEVEVPKDLSEAVTIYGTAVCSEKRTL